MAMEGWKITSIGGMGAPPSSRWPGTGPACGDPVIQTQQLSATVYDYPCAVVCGGPHPDSARPADVSSFPWYAGIRAQSVGNGVHLRRGKRQVKAQKIYVGGCFHVISGVLSTCGYAVYAQYVSVEYFNPDFNGLKYDLGTPMFLGWVGSAFHMAGGFFYLWSVCTPLYGGEVK
ncbi:hypothetical protein KUCAC02_001167 [Chaenocephalus aceratus]|uniref:Uncharacterized protein n=1 Tax=Chaenocephalus aceratus TaxID=36190 RepID=A0ACB9XVI9_CHAAC|nr:hypothetical protein KUCAC02_001167 [Chaenocephalus aceratus]